MIQVILIIPEINLIQKANKTTFVSFIIMQIKDSNLVNITQSKILMPGAHSHHFTVGDQISCSMRLG